METIIKKEEYLYVFSRNLFEENKIRHESIKQKNIKKEPILTLIADDHPYLIYGVERDFNKHSKIKIVGTVSSYYELLEKAKELKPDIILLDLKMPGRDEKPLEEYIKELKANTKSKIVIFTNETGWAKIHRCLEIGASAYIEKAISIGDLSELIPKIYESNELIVYTTEDLPEVILSERQIEVLHCIAEGKENTEIASMFKIDIKTVQSYIHEVKTKFSRAFGIHPITPRRLMLLASKLGFGVQ